MPAVQYFVDRFSDSPWGMYYFLTMGAFEDLTAVEEYSRNLVALIRSGSRNPLKLVLVGVGERHASTFLKRLDNLKTGSPIDLWDYWVIKDMAGLFRIYSEMIDSCRIVGSKGVVRDSAGAVVADYSKSGMPTLLRFVLPENTSSFCVDLGDTVAMQRIC